MVTMAGWYRSSYEGEELFVIFRIDDNWYWQRMAFDRLTPQGMVNGPYVTDVEAYMAAIERMD